MTLETDEARRLLHAEREQALGRRRGAEAQFESDDDTPESSVSGEHPGDAATQVSDREVAQTSLEHADYEIQEVDAALARVDDATYGFCEVDGAPIDPDRLRAKPAARFCTVHQQEVESQV